MPTSKSQWFNVTAAAMESATHLLDRSVKLLTFAVEDEDTEKIVAMARLVSSVNDAAEKIATLQREQSK